MNIGLMQPYFFPYIGYWQLINAVDTYVIYDDVNFIKGGWINRNNILMNGEAKLITLHLRGASPNKLINEVEVSEDPTYNKKLIKTIEQCYKKAPCFDNVFPLIEAILNQDENILSKYLASSINQICHYLSIDTQILVSSDLKKNSELKSQDKVIEICKVLGADRYFNAIGGQSLYSHSDFNNEGIQLNFLQTGAIKYQQLSSEFIPNLSIIDVLMFNSKDNISQMLNHFTLKTEQ